MKKDDCIFCKIANGQIPSTTLYEDDTFRVILDLGPASKGHCLIIPKDHYQDLTELPDEVSAKALPIAKKLGIAFMKEFGAAGFNLVQNNGAEAGQSVMHFHIHVIPRYTGGHEVPLWKPGKLTEEDAKAIKEAIKI